MTWAVVATMVWLLTALYSIFMLADREFLWLNAVNAASQPSCIVLNTGSAMVCSNGVQLSRSSETDVPTFVSVPDESRCREPCYCDRPPVCNSSVSAALVCSLGQSANASWQEAVRLYVLVRLHSPVLLLALSFGLF